MAYAAVYRAVVSIVFYSVDLFYLHM